MGQYFRAPLGVDTVPMDRHNCEWGQVPASSARDRFDGGDGGHVQVRGRNRLGSSLGKGGPGSPTHISAVCDGGHEQVSGVGRTR